MVGNERERMIAKYKRLPRWDPTGTKMMKPKLVEDLRRTEQFQNNAKFAFDEVVRFAEASGRMTLGTTEFPMKRLSQSFKPTRG